MSRTARFVMLFVILAATLALAAPAGAQEPVIAPAPCTEPGSLTMWVWDEAWATIIGDSIEVWKEKYCPGAEVEIVQQPWEQYWDVLKTNAAGGDLPDVFNLTQDFFYFYADNDVVLDLQPYWDEAGVDTKVWGTGLVDPYRWGENGDLYAGPVNWDTVVVFYNKAMFDAAGVAYPTAEWTWDDFAAAAEALTNPDTGVYGAAVYSEYQAGYPNWIAATGVTPVVAAGRSACTLTDEGSIEALNFLKGLLDKGYMPTISIMGGASANDSFNFWLSEQVAMVANGSWMLAAPELKDAPFDWDVVQLPRHPETGRSRSILHAVGYVASANTENPDLAANLILFLVSDEGQQFFAEGGSVAPANPSPALQQMWVDSVLENLGKPDLNIQAFVDATVDSQGVTAYDEIWDKINTEIVVNIFDLGVSVEDATQQTCDFIADYLAE